MSVDSSPTVFDEWPARADRLKVPTIRHPRASGDLVTLSPSSPRKRGSHNPCELPDIRFANSGMTSA